MIYFGKFTLEQFENAPLGEKKFFCLLKIHVKATFLIKEGSINAKCFHKILYEQEEFFFFIKLHSLLRTLRKCQKLAALLSLITNGTIVSYSFCR